MLFLFRGATVLNTTPHLNVEFFNKIFKKSLVDRAELESATP